MKESKPGTHVGPILMIAGAVLAVSSNAVARQIANSYPIGEVVFFRYFFSIPITLAFASKQIFHSGIKTCYFNLHLLRAVCAVGAATCLYITSMHIPFADMTALTYTAPIFVLLLSMPLLGEEVDLRRLTAVFLGFLGVCVIASPAHLSLWSFGALAMAILKALSIIQTRELGKKEDTKITALYSACLCSIVSISLLWLDIFLVPSLYDLAKFLVLGSLGGLTTYCYVLALRYETAAKLAPFDYSGILVSVFIGLTVWSETPTSSMIFGSLLIFFSGIYGIGTRLPFQASSLTRFKAILLRGHK